MTRYEDFNKLRELFKLIKIDRGYSKFIQTGDLDFYDYGTGFIDLQIFPVYDIQNNKHYVRIWFGTIDDGDFGGWKEVDNKEKADKLVDKIANEVFKDMVAFPTKKLLNILLRKYGISVDYE